MYSMGRRGGLNYNGVDERSYFVIMAGVEGDVDFTKGTL